MANQPINMNKLRRVLKLHFQGKNKLQISASTGLSRNTVRKYLAMQRALGISWSDVLLKSDKELSDLFSTNVLEVTDERLSDLHAYFAEHDKRLGQRGMTLWRMYGQYASGRPHCYCVTAFYKHHKLWKSQVQVSMHIVHKVGDKMYVDFTGEKLRYCDPDTGEILTAEVFVAILGASQLTYVEATPSQRVEDFIGCCQRSLHFFGGAPNAIVPDNLKSAVIKSNRYEPQLNENFEGFTDHYGMAALPARAYKPKDKALVEGAVKIIYTKIFAELPAQPPESLEALNAAIWVLLQKHNNDRFKGRTYSRMQQFVEMEQQALQPLPAELYELRHSLQATALKNGHVCLSPDKHFYSVPSGLVGKKLRLLYSASVVEVYYKYELVATHRRARSMHCYTTARAHMPAGHQALEAFSAEYFLEKAKAIGPGVENYIRQVLQRRNYPAMAYKSCQGILWLGRSVGPQRLEKACRRAESFQLYGFRVVEGILKRGLDDDAAQPEEIEMPLHENIRGKKYYQQSTDESLLTGEGHE